MIHQAAGLLGVDPQPLTLREMFWMLRGRFPPQPVMGQGVRLGRHNIAGYAEAFCSPRDKYEYVIDSKTGKMARRERVAS